MRLPVTLGRYEFLSLLGVGGGGAVYAGREHGAFGLVHDVAIKVLDGEEALTRVASKARSLLRLAHPCVVPPREVAVLEHEELGALHVAVMPMVRGSKLSSLLRRCREDGGVMPLAATLRLLLQVADTLEAVHQATDAEGRPLGLVHGDLTPADLVLTEHGNLRILGFADPGPGGATEREGAPRQRSPEQAAGQPADRRSDLYAVGTIAFELLLGEPYVAALLFDRLPSVREQLAETHGLEGGAAEHLSDLLLRLLQEDRELRFPHARSLGAALEVAADGVPLRRARRWLAGVVGGLPLSDRSGLGIGRPRRASRAVPNTPASAPESPWLLPVGVIGVLVVALGAAGLWGGDTGPETRTITQAPTASQLEAAAAALPPLHIEHVPPLPSPESRDRVFRATLSGGTVDCVPRLQMRAVVGGRWMSRPMRGSGAEWELPMTSTELDAFAGAVEYWIRCGRRGLAPRAQWRSEEAPVRLEL